MADIENTVEPQNLDADDVPLTKQKNKGGRPKKEVLPKEKKPRTEKQTQALQKAMETRKVNIEARKLQKKIEASKLLLSLEQSPPLKKPSTPAEESSEEEEEEEEVQPVKPVKAKKAPAKKEKKMKGKKIIIYQADDSSDSSDSEDEVVSDNEPKHFKTQQNKKSLIKVYNKPQIHNPKPVNLAKNYFVD